MADPPDSVAAALDEIRGRDTAGIKGHPWIEDVPRLLSAIDAVLTLTSEWAARAAGLEQSPLAVQRAEARDLHDHVRSLNGAIQARLLERQRRS